MQTKIFKLLKDIVGLSLDLLSRLRKIFLVKRKGIIYEVDISESVDRAIFLRGWEPQTIKLLHKLIKLGDSVIEVGANVGAHSLIISKIIGKNGNLVAILCFIHSFLLNLYSDNALMPNTMPKKQ